MKRIFALLLIAVLLCGCSAAASPSANPVTGNHTAADPTEVTLPPVESYSEDTGLIVTFKMGAEFEMVLNMYHAVLEVNSLNDEAETLLGGVDVAGVSYRSAVETILEEAQNQDLLKNGSVINLAAKAVDKDSWTVASHMILTWPVENYQQNSGINFTCELIPAGKVFDAHSYTDTHTRERADHYEVVCYAGSVHQMTYSVYEDGTYGEDYYPSRDRSLNAAYLPDGSFVFADYDNKSNGFTYTIQPDGSYDCYSFAEGILIFRTERYGDGSGYEDYYENDVLVRSVWTNPDGTTTETHYDSNGNPIAAQTEP